MQDKTIIHNLNERLKEMECLYETLKLTSDTNKPADEILKHIPILIKKAWQYPKITEVNIIVNQQTYQTDNFSETKWCLSSNITVFGDVIGKILVCYKSRKPDEYQGPFLKEEITLLNALSMQISKMFERQKTKQALIESESRYRKFVELSPDPIAVRRHGIFLYINQAGADLLEATKPEEIIGKSIFDFLHPDFKEIVERRIEKSMSGKIAQLMEEKFITLDGRIKYIEVAGSPIYFEGEKATLIIFRDVTQKKKQEHKQNRINQLNSLRGEINELFVRIFDVNKLLEEVCKIFFEKSDFELVWIGEIKRDIVQIDAYNGKINVDNVLIENKCIILNKIILGKIKKGNFHICDKITDAIKVECCKAPTGYDIKNAGLFPLWMGKEIKKVLAVFSAESSYFAGEIILLLEKISADLSLVLTSRDYEKKLNQNFYADKKSNSDTETEPDADRVLSGIITGKYTINDIITADEHFKEQLQSLPKIAKNNLPVLILGESGTGKELIASAIKNLSERKDKPFLTVNCSALPDNLLESELFGYVKGAFTGAENRKVGLLQSADGGTIFLDEIGDMSYSMQVKILRAVQQKEFIQLGATKQTRIDIRFIFATNKNLKKMVEKEKFREDLYYRISPIVVELPPLRKRKGDIRLLINHFVEKFNASMQKSLSVSDEVYNTLLTYNFPGNVRELENFIKRAFIYCEEGEIRLNHLPKRIISKSNKAKKHLSRKSLKKSELALIKHRLKENKRNVIKTAKELGIHHSTLYRKIKKYNL